MDELQYALSGAPQVLEFDPAETARQGYVLTEFQPIYYAAESIVDARDKMMWVLEPIFFYWFYNVFWALQKLCCFTATTICIEIQRGERNDGNGSEESKDASREND